jgi:hypothetical protein
MIPIYFNDVYTSFAEVRQKNKNNIIFMFYFHLSFISKYNSNLEYISSETTTAKNQLSRNTYKIFVPLLMSGMLV